MSIKMPFITIWVNFMKLRTFILVTTALLAVPTISHSRPSSSYSSSSSRSIGGGSSYRSTSRSVSSYGSSGSSARSSMNSMGSSVSGGWFSRKSSPSPSPSVAATTPRSVPTSIPTPKAAPQVETARQDNNYRHPDMRDSDYGNYRSAPPPYYNGGNSNSDTFISSMAGATVGSAIANAGHDREERQEHVTVTTTTPSTNSTVTPTEPQESNVATPVVQVPTTAGQAPEQHSHILFWFFMLLLAGGGAAATILYYRSLDDSKPVKKDDKPKHEEKKQFYPGMNVVIDPLIIQSDTDSKNCQLHFEADTKGRATVLGVSQMGNIWHLYFDKNTDEFLRLYVVDGEVKESRFFSYINQYPIGVESDMDNWLGDDGLIGSSMFVTEDGIRWSREAFENNDSRLPPDENHEKIVFIDSSQKWKTFSSMYYRATGFDSGFPEKEYLFVEFMRGKKDDTAAAFVKTWAGVDIPVYSLDLI